MRSRQLVFHVALAQDLQPNGRDHVELGSESLGHIVAMIVPLEWEQKRIEQCLPVYFRIIITGVT